MIESLLDPKTYGTENVELIETYISWVFLAGDLVYKVKKPVNYGYLDFSTLEKRKHYCEEELRLNKRTTDIYLNVVPITKTKSGFEIGGEGEIVDYAVKMKRLPADAQMSELLANDEITKKDLGKIASRLADFHSRAEIVEGFGYDTAKFNWDENFEQTEKFVDEIVEPHKYRFMKHRIEQFLARNKALFDRREQEGKIRDCHGDLHSGNIFITDKIHIFDCIEFNERFRYGDVASEVAFLAMDLDFHGEQELSKHFVDKYIEASEDIELNKLLDFYKCYRAYVRAKVNCFRFEQGDEEAKSEASKYFDLAYEYSKSLCCDAIIMHGFSGTGKSYVANLISNELNAEYINADEIRRDIIGKSQKPLEDVGYGEGIYAPEFKAKVYGALFDVAKKALQNNKTAVMDASFSKPRNIETAYKLAKKAGVEPLLIDCVCPEEIVKERLEQRQKDPNNVSEAVFHIYEAQKEHAKPIPKSVRSVTIDTTISNRDAVKKVVNALA